ncbi:restriction endonuclease subunit S [Salinibacter ruber]|uniref:restriction endonuclease subunit S n=1 Tax=Salinibacter ruber TaxID=146919 RepID=UPI002167705E|nr:restriction endonuclease subunit S [Salinibacter ruber]MCS3643222.1 type I restriction enzyme S subunit [Salinibacter ruber]
MPKAPTLFDNVMSESDTEYNAQSQWKKKPLEECVTLKSGSTPRRSDEENWGGHLPWISAKSLHQFLIDDAEEYVSKVGAEKSRIVDEDTILVLVRGMRLAKEFPVGITRRPVTFNQDVKAAIPKNGIDPLYLAYALKGQESRALNWTSKTTHGTLRLTTPQLKEIPIPVPSPEEQSRIAKILGTWDRAIEQVDALIEQKRERLHGLRQRLLTGEVRFPEFDKPWVDEEIGSLLKRVYRYVDWDDEATYDLVSIKRDSQGMIFRESLKGSDIKTKTLNTLKEADFVISRMQVVHGATAYVSEEFDGMKASDSYIILVPRDEDRIDTEFFAELSKLPYLYHIAFTSSYGVHIEKMTFNLEWYFESEVHIPPSVEEQRKIVSFLNEVKSEINTLEEKRDALQRQKKGLMQRLLTGAVRTV